MERRYTELLEGEKISLPQVYHSLDILGGHERGEEEEEEKDLGGRRGG